MTTKVTLIFPPVTDPRAPQLALPSLAAVLRPAGVDTELLDLSATGVEWLLRRERLEAALDRVRGGGAVSERHALRRERVARMGEHLLEWAPRATSVLRSERFYDANTFNAARELIGGALELTAAASSRAITYDLSTITYAVEGVSPRKLADLLRVTADREANLFAEHWEEEVFPALERRAPDLVGITITNRQQILPGLMLARALRSRGHFVVIGGTVFTKFAGALSRRPEFFSTFADGVVVYEGETAILELQAQLGGGRDLSRVPNLLYLERGEVRATPTHVEDVEALPSPDFGGLPLNSYLAPELTLPILTGKGCYFNRCKFCDIPYINHISRKAYRLRSPERIAADVESLEARFGASRFVITDEALSPRLLLELADVLPPAERSGWSFTGYARLEEGFTPQTCRRIRAMGMRKLFFGLESASQVTLDHMDKGVDVQRVPAVLRACRDAGINFHIFSIIGFPEETEASARETFAFFVDNAEVIDHPGNSFDIHPFGLELRTAYWEEREERGVVVRVGALTEDFVIGLGGSEWENPRGLGRRDVERLLGEFTPALRRLFRRWHNTPGQLWPGFEEYSVLYAERWGDGPVPFATALPERGRVRVRVSSAFAPIDDGGERVTLAGVRESFDLSRRTWAALSEGKLETRAELLQRLTRSVAAEDREAAEVLAAERIEDLVGRGLLQLELELEGASPVEAGPHGARGAAAP